MCPDQMRDDEEEREIIEAAKRRQKETKETAQAKDNPKDVDDIESKKRR